MSCPCISDDVPISGTVTGNTLDVVTSAFLCSGTSVEIKFTQGAISGNTINGYYALYLLNGDYYDDGTFHLEKQ